MRLPDARTIPRGLGLLLLSAALVACSDLNQASDGEDASASSQIDPEPPKARPEIPVSEESRQLVDRYARIENDLRARGLLRVDCGGPDAPINADLLARNFLRIALFDEFSASSGRLVARETESYLRRWEMPVRLEMQFGASVSAEQLKTDMATVGTLSARLARASGHDIAITGAGSGNFQIVVVNEDERRAMTPGLRAAFPGINDAVLRTIMDMPPSTFCLVIAFSSDDAPYTYRRGLAIIRAEHPPLLRQACFHEEIAQGLGLANDSPAARPSIFNDDEEFALLTTQDELMLAILFDARLSPGMSREEAAPIVQTIAEELLPMRAATLDPKES